MSRALVYSLLLLLKYMVKKNCEKHYKGKEKNTWKDNIWVEAGYSYILISEEM